MRKVCGSVNPLHKGSSKISPNQKLIKLLVFFIDIATFGRSTSVTGGTPEKGATYSLGSVNRRLIYPNLVPQYRSVQGILVGVQTTIEGEHPILTSRGSLIQGQHSILTGPPSQRISPCREQIRRQPRVWLTVVQGHHYAVRHVTRRPLYLFHPLVFKLYNRAVVISSSECFVDDAKRAKLPLLAGGAHSFPQLAGSWCDRTPFGDRVTKGSNKWHPRFA